jgi:Na+/H+ antiporter NhaD/arsenite permease-like protein
MDLLAAIDFDVLVLLGGIMAINFIMVHQTETKRIIRFVQNKIQLDPVHGFWLVSLAAFVVSPFLTNDGVCLLFVEPILNAFESLPPCSLEPSAPSSQLKLMKSDAIYFLLALACSSNIGSSLTYTGNTTLSHLSNNSNDN